ncbi:MAG: glycosyltransferase family 39 protein [Bacteroidia bacterium]|nr:glycosyltransferase family 39 protein [Bacteroidia bacterium]
MNLVTIKYNALISLIAALLFIPFLGNVHLFDWDEINFAECAREMLVTDDYFSVTINYQPFWEKPPVFIWMQALSMKMFGVNEFAARFPNAICGIITLNVLFNIGRKLVDKRFGILWTLIYAGSFLPHFYFKSGIIDPWFNLFIFLGIYYFILFSHNRSEGNKNIVLSALFIGIAIMTKGPVALLVFGLCFTVFFVLNRFQSIISFKQLFIYGLTLLSVGSLWFIMLALTGHSDIIIEFFVYQVRLFKTQDAGHGGPFFYHWIVLLVGCFPLSIIALGAFKKDNLDVPSQKHFKRWMLILFWVVLILFSIVKTKIVHYSSLCYFPLSYLAVYVAYKLINGELRWKKLYTVLLMLIATVIGIAVAALPIIDKYKTPIIEANLIKDAFAIENLKATVSWTGFEWLIGLGFIIGTAIMLRFIHQGKLKMGLVGVFLLSVVVINSASVMITPKIEQYSQGAAIEFYESLQAEDCYVETIGFKSYAHLFYTAKRKPTNANSYDMNWLLAGEIDKPVYFVCKINLANDIKNNHPFLKELYRKNGFVFWKREVLVNNN